MDKADLKEKREFIEFIENPKLSENDVQVIGRKFINAIQIIALLDKTTETNQEFFDKHDINLDHCTIYDVVDIYYRIRKTQEINNECFKCYGQIKNIATSIQKLGAEVLRLKGMPEEWVNTFSVDGIVKTANAFCKVQEDCKTCPLKNKCELKRKTRR